MQFFFCQDSTQIRYRESQTVVMYIEKNIYSCLCAVRVADAPEIGGILGGRAGVITHFVLDQGLKTNRTDFYIPNTVYLNEALAQWQDGDIEFYGILHTHPHGGEALSCADKAYIDKIVRTCSKEEQSLYFPIILPKHEMLAYSARVVNGTVVIQQESIFVM